MNTLRAIVLTLIIGGPLAAATFNLDKTTTIIWSEKEDASQVLTTPDSFTKQLSRFDRAVRLKRNDQISPEHFLKFVGQQALDWTPSEIERFRDSLERIKPPLQSLKLSFPKKILLIKTSGKDEPAPYTRQHAIILPEAVVRSPRKPDALLAHELFHILTRNAPAEFRSRLYKTIGFEPCNPIRLPGKLNEKRITNPDAPIYDHFIRVTRGGKITSVIPVLLTKSADYDPDASAPFFSYLEQRFIEIENRMGRWQVRQLGTDAATWSFDEAEDFYPQIGGNRYSVFQPEEILARHFTSLIMATNLPDDSSVASRLKNALSSRD